MKETSVFARIFQHLRAILEPYASHLRVTSDGDDLYSLDGPYSQKFKRMLFFGSVQVQKNYVSFYLMPVYMYPDLLETISPALKKRMQGKSCFNFKRVDEELLAELAGLAQRGFERFRQET